MARPIGSRVRKAVLAALLSVSGVSLADQHHNQTIKSDLSGLIRIALMHNAIIEEAGHDVAMARARVKQARSGYFPSVDIKAGSFLLEEGLAYRVSPGSISFDMSQLGLPAIGNFDPNQPITNTTSMEIPITEKWINFGLVTLTQPLYTGGLITGFNRMAKQGLQAAKHGQRLKKQEVIYTVIRRFNDVLLTRELFEIADSTLVKLRVLLDITKRIFDAGSRKVNRLDYLKMKIFVSTVANFVEAMRETRALAMEGLKFAVGVDGSRRITLTQTDFPITPYLASCDESIRRALKQRPEVGQVRSGLAALEAGVDVARSEYIPDLAFTGGYMIDDRSIRFTDGNTLYGGLVLNLPLFEGFRTPAKVGEARAKLNKLKSKKKLLDLGISIQVRKAHMDMQRAEKQVQITKEALQDAIEYLNLSDRSYQADLIELPELLQAQIMEALMRMQHMKAIYDQSNYTLDLNKAMGVLASYYREG